MKPFRKGQKVQVLKAHKHLGIKAGAIGVVTEVETANLAGGRYDGIEVTVPAVRKITFQPSELKPIARRKARK